MAVIFELSLHVNVMSRCVCCHSVVYGINKKRQLSGIIRIYGGSIFVVFMGSLPHEFTSSTKASLQTVISLYIFFFTETENRCIQEITSRE